MRNIFICTWQAIKVTTCPQNLNFGPPFGGWIAVEILSPFSLILASTFFNFTAFSGCFQLPSSQHSASQHPASSSLSTHLIHFSFLRAGFPRSFPSLAITDWVLDNSKHGNGPKEQQDEPGESESWRVRSRGNKKCGYSVQRPSWNAINYVVGRAARRAARGAWQSGAHFGSFGSSAMCTRNTWGSWGYGDCRLRYVFGSKLNFCQRRKKLQIFVLRTALMRHRKRRAISPAESWRPPLPPLPLLRLSSSWICFVATASLWACVRAYLCVCVQLAALVSGKMANGQEPN